MRYPISQKQVPVVSKVDTFATRGCVLIERGELEEGLALLEGAVDHDSDPHLRAWNTCYLALGEARKGNLEEARSLATSARRLDPECMLLVKVGQELTGLTG